MILSTYIEQANVIACPNCMYIPASEYKNVNNHERIIPYKMTCTWCKQEVKPIVIKVNVEAPRNGK